MNLDHKNDSMLYYSFLLIFINYIVSPLNSLFYLQFIILSPVVNIILHQSSNHDLTHSARFHQYLNY